MCVWQFECRVCTLLRAGVGVTSTMLLEGGKGGGGGDESAGDESGEGGKVIRGIVNFRREVRGRPLHRPRSCRDRRRREMPS